MPTSSSFKEKAWQSCFFNLFVNFGFGCPTERESAILQQLVGDLIYSNITRVVRLIVM